MNMFEQQKQMRNITDDNQLMEYMQDPMMQQAAMQEMQRRSRLRQSDLAQKPMPQDGAAHFAYGNPRDVALFDPYGTDLVPAYENYFTSAAESLGARGGANNAVSRVGASGRMQIMEGTAKGMGMNWDDRFDEDTSIKYGSQYNNQMRGMFGEDPRMMNAAYNAGPGRVRGLVEKYGNSYDAIEPHLPEETRGYVAKIKKMRDEYLGNGGTAGTPGAGFTGGAGGAPEPEYRNDPTMLDELKQETERANATEEELRFLEEQNNREFLPPDKLVSKGQPLPQGFGFSSTGSKEQLMGLGAADRQNPVGYAQGGIVGTQHFANTGVVQNSWPDKVSDWPWEAAKRAGMSIYEFMTNLTDPMLDPIEPGAQPTIKAGDLPQDLSEGASSTVLDFFARDTPPVPGSAGARSLEAQRIQEERRQAQEVEAAQPEPEGPSLWDSHIEASKQRGTAFEKQLGQVKDWFGGGPAPEAATAPAPPQAPPQAPPKWNDDRQHPPSGPYGAMVRPSDAEQAINDLLMPMTPISENVPEAPSGPMSLTGDPAVPPTAPQNINTPPVGERVAEVRPSGGGGRPGGGFIGNQYRLHDYADQQMRSRNEQDRRYRNNYYQSQRYNTVNDKGRTGIAAFMMAEKAARRDHANMRQSAQSMGLKDVEMQNKINTRGLLYEGGLEQAGIAARAKTAGKAIDFKLWQNANDEVKTAQTALTEALKAASKPNINDLDGAKAKAAVTAAEKNLAEAQYKADYITQKLHGIPSRPTEAEPAKRNIFGDTTMGSKPTL